MHRPFTMAMVTLNSAMAAGARGVEAAHARAATAATEIARAGVLAGEDTVTLSGEPPADVVRGAVDLRVARYQQTASLAVIRTASETQREVLEIV